MPSPASASFCATPNPRLKLPSLGGKANGIEQNQSVPWIFSSRGYLSLGFFQVVASKQKIFNFCSGLGHLVVSPEGMAVCYWEVLQASAPGSRESNRKSQRPRNGAPKFGSLWSSRELPERCGEWDMSHLLKTWYKNGRSPEPCTGFRKAEFRSYFRLGLALTNLPLPESVLIVAHMA